MCPSGGAHFVVLHYCAHLLSYAMKLLDIRSTHGFLDQVNNGAFAAGATTAYDVEIFKTTKHVVAPIYR